MAMMKVSASFPHEMDALVMRENRGLKSMDMQEFLTGG